ncbi:uncharacterized protein LOC119652190 [Hermetia illucens]|uniref:uncharacterized protein LOC119652190 n=1 Tax=Hermetia illucens TaxID=343691 RepID=UPI0018CC67E5|nr:uncharacterized protein LOC119652190 [Hermetia illucens]
MPTDGLSAPFRNALAISFPVLGINCCQAISELFRDNMEGFGLCLASVSPCLALGKNVTLFPPVTSRDTIRTLLLARTVLRWILSVVKCLHNGMTRKKARKGMLMTLNAKLADYVVYVLS